MAVPKMYTRAEAMPLIRVGKTKMGELIKSGELKVRRIGRTVLISEDAIREFLLLDRNAA